jgi:hypothetical protein
MLSRKVDWALTNCWIDSNCGNTRIVRIRIIWCYDALIPRLVENHHQDWWCSCLYFSIFQELSGFWFALINSHVKYIKPILKAHFWKSARKRQKKARSWSPEKLPFPMQYPSGENDVCGFSHNRFTFPQRTRLSCPKFYSITWTASTNKHFWSGDKHFGSHHTIWHESHDYISHLWPVPIWVTLWPLKNVDKSHQKVWFSHCRPFSKGGMWVEHFVHSQQRSCSTDCSLRG